MDDNSSHYNLDAFTLARENDVIIYTLVPHTSCVMQSLHTAVFGPLRKNWNEECHNCVRSNPRKVITKCQFSKIFSDAWLKRWWTKAMSTLKKPNSIHWCHFHLHISNKVAKSVAKLINQLCGKLQPAMCLSRGMETLEDHLRTHGHLTSPRNKL